VAGVLTRLMCSSFTDGSAAVVVAGPSVAAPPSAPRIVGSVARSGNGELDYHDRMAMTAEAGLTSVDTPGLVVNPSGGLVGRGHPLGATGLTQIVELANQFRRRATGRQVEGRIGVAVNTGGIVHGDAGIIGIHAVRAGSAA
jgi:acetyl-CoA acetyltransferase